MQRDSLGCDFYLCHNEVDRILWVEQTWKIYHCASFPILSLYMAMKQEKWWIFRPMQIEQTSNRPQKIPL